MSRWQVAFLRCALVWLLANGALGIVVALRPGLTGVLAPTHAHLGMIGFFLSMSPMSYRRLSTMNTAMPWEIITTMGGTVVPEVKKMEARSPRSAAVASTSRSSSRCAHAS